MYHSFSFSFIYHRSKSHHDARRRPGEGEVFRVAVEGGRGRGLVETGRLGHHAAVHVWLLLRLSAAVIEGVSPARRRS